MGSRLNTVAFNNRDGSTTIETVPECCRCGLCCLSEPCPVAVLAFGLAPAFGPGGLRPVGRCPGLSFSPSGRAVCELANDWELHADVWAALGVHDGDKGRRARLGFGVGCCIKARCVGPSGLSVSFATLPDDVKRRLVQSKVSQS